MMPDPTNGQAEWVRAALERFEGPLVRYAQRLAGSAEQGRDAVQETFLQLCRARREVVDGRLAEWLFTVCRNQVFAWRRKENRMTPQTDAALAERPAHDPSPAQAAEQREAGAQALDWLEALPQNQREVLRLKFQSGLSYQEISRVTGHSVSNVGFLLHRGLKTLRERAGT